MHMQHKVFLSIMLLFCCASAKAQILFPKGNSLSLQCIDAMEYSKTAIFFRVTKGKITDYSYKVLITQLQPEWDLDACINGECRFGIPDSLPIYQFSGQPDSSGFIMFHIFHNQTPGQSTLSLKLSSKLWPDTATLYYHFYYLGNALGSEISHRKFPLVFPSPANAFLRIPKQENATYSLVNMQGIELCKGTVIGDIDTRDFPSGVYILNVQIGNQTPLTQKIIIQH